MSVKIGNYEIVCWLVVGVCLLILSIQDLIFHEVNILIICIGLIMGVMAEIIGDKGIWKMIFGLMPGIAILIAGYLSKEAIGYGDGLATMVIGCLIGLWDTMAIVLYAFILSALVSLILIVFCKRKKKIAFIPFLLVGFVGVGLL